jgi:hypothetical protein
MENFKEIFYAEGLEWMQPVDLLKENGVLILS